MPSPRLLWFGFLGGPVAWSLQLLASYPVAANACRQGVEGAMWWLALISLFGIGTSLAALVASLRSHRMTDEAVSGGKAVSGRVRFMSRAGLITSGTFVVATMLHAGSLLLVGAC